MSVIIFSLHDLLINLLCSSNAVLCRRSRQNELGVKSFCHYYFKPAEGAAATRTVHTPEVGPHLAASKKLTFSPRPALLQAAEPLVPE